MGCPAHTDPFLAMSAAAEHIAAGRVAEVELEWWADPPEDSQGMEHRMTITMRARPTRGPLRVPLLSAPEPPVPDDASGLEGGDADRSG